MFLNCIGTFDSIVGRKEDMHVNWELVYELCISYERYKENIMFYELMTHLECKIAFIGVDNKV